MSCVVSFVQTKGGSGKSTVACLMGQALTSDVFKKSVLLVDTDPQRTTTKWSQKELSRPDYYVYEKERELGTTIQKAKEKYDYVLMDTAGFENKTNILAISASDVVLAPVQESNPDIAGAQKSFFPRGRGREHCGAFYSFWRCF